jgi:hypothetical protein
MTEPVPSVRDLVAAARADDESYPGYAARRGTRPRGLVTLADVATRTNAGEDFFFCVREHLSALTLVPLGERSALVADRPADIADEVAQAYLGALAEHVCAAAGVAAPPWAGEPDRFLDRLWFGTDTPGLEPWCLVESPAAFRRRGLFITRGRLERV